MFQSFYLHKHSFSKIIRCQTKGVIFATYHSDGSVVSIQKTVTACVSLCVLR